MEAQGEINMINETKLFNGFYSKKRVLITGHTGFKGSWLTLWLLSLGAKVAGYSLYYPSKPCNFIVCALRKHTINIAGDIRDLSSLRTVFQKFKPEIVFHLAAQPIVKKSFEEPKTTFDTNIGGTVNVLECIRITGSVKGAVIITSDKCYRNEERKEGYIETDTLGGDDPYSASKAGAEIVAHAYIKSFFNSRKSARICTVRAGNVIGGGDWAPDRIIPDCIRSFSENKKAIIRNPDAKRPWQHVLEPLSGYLWLGSKLCFNSKLQGESFNFGPAKDVNQSVKEVAEKLSYLWGDGKWLVNKQKRFGKEANLLKLSCDKAARLLHWHPILTFDDTIRMTSEWYKKYYESKENMYLYSIAQIDEYVKQALRRNLSWTRGKR